MLYPIAYLLIIKNSSLKVLLNEQFITAIVRVPLLDKYTVHFYYIIHIRLYTQVFSGQPHLIISIEITLFWGSWQCVYR